MSRAFLRRIKVSVGFRDTVGREWSNESAIELGGRVVDREGLRITFDSSADTDEEPNLSKITIYNLAEDSRGFLDSGVGPDSRVILEAGYQGRTGRIFTGDIFRTTHVHNGIDWMSTIEAGDGLATYTDGFVSVVRGRGVTRRSILEDVASQIGLGISFPEGAFNEATRRSISFHGPARNLIRRLAHSSGNTWSIQDRVIELLAEADAVNLPAVLLTTETGLINRPSPLRSKIRTEAPRRRQRRGRRRREVDEGGVQAQSLLNATLRPGRLVRLESRQATGNFVVRDVSHSGDTHGPQWTSDMRLYEL